MKKVLGQLLHNIIFFLSNTSRLSSFVTLIIDRVMAELCRSGTLARWVGSSTLWMVAILFKISAKLYPDFKKRVGEKSFTSQIKTKDGVLARSFTFQKGKIRSRSGRHPKPDVTQINALLG